jgi:hypothetical protein
MDDVAERGRYFGAAWPSGVCDHGVQVDTPTDATCLFCHEHFVDGDRGWFFAGPDGSAVHRECGLRMIVGGIECLKREKAGRHVVGDHEPDPPHLTKREAAQAAWAWVQEHGL